MKQTHLRTSEPDSTVCIRCGVFPAEQTVECPRWCWHCSERTRNALQATLWTWGDMLGYYEPLIDTYRLKRLPPTWSMRGQSYSVKALMRSVLNKHATSEVEFYACLRDMYYLSEWWHYVRLGETE